MRDKIREYQAESITVGFDARRCIHARECVRGLPRVFDINRRVWIDPAQADADGIAAVIKRCPTGALHFRRKDDGTEEAIPDRNEIRIVTDGPLYVRGNLEIHTAAGVVHDTRAALCRCGASANKPFCDNSHRTTGFQDAANAHPAGGVATCSGLLRVLPQSNGPCRMEGSFLLSSGDAATAFACGPVTSLCRCGRSRNKPFCDGSHAHADAANQQRSGGE